MAMQLDQVVPFGRSLDEYRLMFSLSEEDLAKAIIGIADGPASFNAEMHALGKRVVSVDPRYAFSGADIEQQFYAVVDDIIRQVTSTPDDWVWSYHHSADHLRDNRVQALRQFATDYETGRAEGRYATGALPQLDFTRDQFDLALCSHFLFLYSDHFPYAFHRAAIAEMLRVAAEVRIFPLMTLTLTPSPYVESLLWDFTAQGYVAEIHTVSYELLRGGNQMLSIKKHPNQ